ncbi:MAG: glycosyltransferase [Phycisphaerales bacterium]
MPLRILMVTNRPPVPANNGGRQRSALLIDALQRIGPTDLILVANPDRQKEQALQDMRQRCGLKGCIEPAREARRFPWKAIRWIAPTIMDRAALNLGHRRHDYAPDPGVARFIAELHRRERYDLIIGRYAAPASKGAIHELGVPTLLDIDDLDATVYRSRLEAGATGLQRWLDRRHLAQVEGIIADVYRRFGHIWVANPGDEARIDHPSVSTLPNVPYAVPEDAGLAPITDPRRAGVVASWSHPANERGLRRFVSRCWGDIVAREPGARLSIYGGGMKPALREWLQRHPGVEPAGFIERITDAYNACAFMIAPVYDGAGTKIKVLESLACRRAILSTAHAYEGFERDLVPGKSIAVGEDDHAMAERCIELMSDPALRDRIAGAGHEIVSARYSQAAVRERIAEDITRLAGSVP